MRKQNGLNLIFLTLTIIAPRAFAETPGNDSTPTAIREDIPATEAADIAKIVRLSEGNVRRDLQGDAEHLARRDAHAKAHGCLQAEFTVQDNLKANLKVGIFSEVKNFPTVIRFSNGNPRIQDDHDGDARGMAIKLLGATGEGDQDFLTMNHPVFFVRTTADYVKFNQAVASGGLSSMAKYFLLGFHFHELGVVRAIQKKKITSLLDQTYHGVTPYALGTQAVKYEVRPCAPLVTLRDEVSPDYLRLDIIDKLAKVPVCFRFGVQMRTDFESQPIEDSTIEWTEKASPFIPLATITIPPQKFDSPEQMAACENLSYNPWHALAEHRPLGNMNRVRKDVYEAVSKLRHELNNTVVN